MKKKLVSATIIMTALMSMGTPVLAAPSPTTGNVNLERIERRVEENDPYIIPKDHSALKIGNVNISSEYNKIENKDYISTGIVASRNSDMTKKLDDFVAKDAPGIRKLDSVKIQMYKSGEAVWDGFEPVTYWFHLGKQYDGQFVTIYHLHKDGSITQTRVQVVNGKAKYVMKDMGTLKLAFK